MADEGTELVVLGLPSRSNLERRLLGSVAPTVLRTFGVPVWGGT
jgi:nucleotide-binding universal stress UspA family protein